MNIDDRYREEEERKRKERKDCDINEKADMSADGQRDGEEFVRGEEEEDEIRRRQR